MTGEMFAHSHDAAVLETSGKGNGMSGHQLGVLAEGAVSDNRVLRIVVNVEHWGEIYLDAHAAALARHLTAVLVQ